MLSITQSILLQMMEAVFLPFECGHDLTEGTVKSSIMTELCS